MTSTQLTPIEKARQAVCAATSEPVDLIGVSGAGQIRRLTNAVHALLGVIEAQQQTINALSARSHEVDPWKPLG